LITDEEAFNAWGEGYTEFWVDAAGGYIAGQVLVKLMEKNITDDMLWLSRLDMMHTLHCVVSTFLFVIITLHQRGMLTKTIEYDY
jgi:hypothetical protein